MGKVARLPYLAVVALTAGCNDYYYPTPYGCTDGESEVSANVPLDALGGETATERFERAARARDCSVTWLEIPAQLGTSEPAPGSSALDLVLERTSDRARFRTYALTPREKWDTNQCQHASVFVPCSLTLRSEDGGLDEVLDGELRLQGENTLLNVQLGAYDFVGTHAVAFTGDVVVDTVELNLGFSPGIDPERVDGGIAESGDLRGSDPYLTTAVIECTSP